ncbi:MAG: carbohydrate kinase family protein [Oscillospiraceae bacterium]|jgi:sugar/nucleoside kinase (ribokinase family)
MSGPRFLITGAAMIDNLHFAGGEQVNGIMGGCGIYSLAGASLFYDGCTALVGVGKDFSQYYGEWIKNNGIDTRGFLVRDEHTAQTVLTYHSDGSYDSRNIYSGKPGMHSKALELGMEDLFPLLRGVEALYLYSDIDGVYGDAYVLKRHFGYKIMWEAPNWIGPDYLPVLLRTVDKCDYWSINRKEARSVFSVDTDDRAIGGIRTIGKPCYFRTGREGAYMVMPDEVFKIPCAVIPGTPEGGGDLSTGCGNCSTAAVMAGLADGKNPLTAGIMGSVAAGYNAMQYGPHRDLGRETRREAEKIVSTMLAQYMKGQ